jgi:hypothetical protein
MQESSAGGVTGYFLDCAGSSLATSRAFFKASTAFWATADEASGALQVAQGGAT